MSVLPVPDVEASRQLGRAAVRAMQAVAAASPAGRRRRRGCLRSTRRLKKERSRPERLPPVTGAGSPAPPAARWRKAIAGRW